MALDLVADIEERNCDGSIAVGVSLVDRGAGSFGGDIELAHGEYLVPPSGTPRHIAGDSSPSMAGKAAACL